MKTLVKKLKNTQKAHGCTGNRTSKRTGKSHINSRTARNARVLRACVRAYKNIILINKNTLSHTCEDIPCVPCVPSVHAGFTRAVTRALTCAPVRSRALYYLLLIINKKENREGK